MLSVVIPTLQAAATLPRTLATLAAARQAGVVTAVVVADGGSADETVALATAAGCRTVAAPRGRGTQLAAGAAAAMADTTGEWLLFLHADTVLAPGWVDAVGGFVAAPGASSRAGYFRFALDDDRPAARRLERMVAWRCRWLALPYGDQGLLIHRRLYDEVGGFRPLALMEDVDMARRLGRARLVALDASAVTAADKWRRQGYWRRSARNLGCLGLYFLGLPPRLIRRLYG